ncbi:MAG TPA: DUF418 domain-containing protein [Kofleriaceae bacterium]|jgi:uncharacterized protein
MTRLEPTAPRERWLVLDVLRGFALFGVLLGNLYNLYTGRWLTTVGVRPPVDTAGIDSAARWFMQLVVEGRAQTLLTFLFGLGFAMQLLRADARGEGVLGLYLRRMCALFAIGAMHMTLLWWGDVTWGYAIAGLALLPLRRASRRTLAIVAIACLVANVACHAIPDNWFALDDLIFGDHCFARLNAAMEAIAYHGSDHIALAHAQIAQGVMWTLMGSGAYMLWLVGRFVIGYIAGLARVFDRDGADHVTLFRRLAIGCGAITACTLTVSILRLSGVLAAPTSQWIGNLYAVVDELGLLAQTAFYVACTVLLLRTRARRMLAIIGPVGRMPLTTYISQSVICTGLFYGWGLHWAMPGDAATLGLAVIIFAIQIAIAHLWLRHYRFGPLEWVWRAVVYLERPRMRI